MYCCVSCISHCDCLFVRLPTSHSFPILLGCLLENKWALREKYHHEQCSTCMLYHGTVASFLDGKWIPWEAHIASLIDAARAKDS